MLKSLFTVKEGGLTYDVNSVGPHQMGKNTGAKLYLTEQDISKTSEELQKTTEILGIDHECIKQISDAAKLAKKQIKSFDINSGGVYKMAAAAQTPKKWKEFVTPHFTFN